MKAALFVEPGRIVLDERPVPDLGRPDALVRVTAPTICGTDLPIRKGERQGRHAAVDDRRRCAGRAAPGRAAVRGAARLGMLVLLTGPLAGTAAAQQMFDPFAGSMAPGAPGPYGSEAGAYVHLLQNFQTMLSGAPQMLSGYLTGAMPPPSAETNPMGSGASGGTQAPGGAGEGGDKAEAPDSTDAADSAFEIFLGACAGGAFLGGYSAASAAAPVAATGVAAPAAATVVASAAAIGCALGVSTAAVSLGAVAGWRLIAP
jgi:hypothetical protein